MRTAVESHQGRRARALQSDAVCRSSVVLGMLIVIVMGSYQGMVLAGVFHAGERPDASGLCAFGHVGGRVCWVRFCYAKFAYALKAPHVVRGLVRGHGDRRCGARLACSVRGAC